MYDLQLDWGSDLSVGSNGDIALSNGSTQINQRVLRRLLTNPGDYIWNLNYGGGLALFVGSASSPIDVEAVIRTQMLLEPTVPSTPAPTVSVHALDKSTGYVVAQITYADPSSDQPIALNVIANR